jgi:hypothetical protein
MKNFARAYRYGVMKPITSLAHSACGLKPRLVGLGILGLLAGCASEPPSTVVSAPPPPPPASTTTTTQVVTAQPNGTPVAVAYPAPNGTPLTPGQTVVVTQAPPAAPQEPILERPSAQHVWIPGYYTYRDNRYVWISGRWEIPPRADAKWIAPRWEKESNGYRFYEGHWDT